MERIVKKEKLNEFIIPVRNILESRIGSKNAISNREIMAQLECNGIVCPHTSTIRQVINQIRVKRLIKNLVAGGRGYYIEDDPEKIHTYIKRLDSRIKAISRVRDSFYFQAKMF